MKATQYPQIELRLALAGREMEPHLHQLGRLARLSPGEDQLLRLLRRFDRLGR